MFSFFIPHSSFHSLPFHSLPDDNGENVIINLDLDLKTTISNGTAVSWGFDFSKKYYISLNVMPFDYPECKIESDIVMDLDPKLKFNAHFQLKTILSSYIRGTSTSSGKSFESPIPEGQRVRDVYYRRFKDNVPPEIPAKSSFVQLLEMGFEPELSRAALDYCDDNVQNAIEMILFSRDELDISSVDKHRIKRDMMELSKMSPPQSKSTESIYKGSTYLIEMVLYIRSRMYTLNEHCIICDQKHLFGSMLKPAVCPRELCWYSFMALGVASDSGGSFASSNDVINLLIEFAVAASESKRREIILDPFPVLIDPDDPKKRRKILDPSAKDYNKALELFKRIPHLPSLYDPPSSGIGVSSVGGFDPLSYGLTNWIISSNRSSIICLPPELRISCIHADQFLMLSAPPEKEARFQILRRKHGSVFAFHGSPPENWHSIIRGGLQVGSGNKYQVTDRGFYGQAIYVSPNVCFHSLSSIIVHISFCFHFLSWNTHFLMHTQEPLVTI